MKYTIRLSPSYQVVYVYCDGKEFCAVHVQWADGLQDAIDRAKKLADMLNFEYGMKLVN